MKIKLLFQFLKLQNTDRADSWRLKNREGQFLKRKTPSYKPWRARYFYMLLIIWLATSKPVLFWIVQTLHRLFSIYFRKSGLVEAKKHPKHGGNEPVLCMSPTKRENHCHSVFFFRKVHFWCNFYQVCGRQEESRRLELLPEVYSSYLISD